MNPPLVSLIIPTLNSVDHIGKCIQSIKKQSYQPIEIIVVDNNSRDNTKQIAQQYTDKVFNHGPERSAQRNYGARKADGDYVFFIDSDMVLSSNVVKASVGKFQSDKKIKGCIIPEQSYGTGFWAQCKILERSYYISVDWMEAARIFDRKTFEKLAGYVETNTGTEDYDLPQRIQACYGYDSIDRINELIYHDEGKMSLFKTCRKKFYYAQDLSAYKKYEANRDHYQKQASIIQRYKLFLSRPRILFEKPVIGFGMLLMKACEFGSGGMGYLLSKVKR